MYKALKTFVGVISMTENEVRDIKNEEVVKDLLKAGYIEEVKAESKIKKLENEIKTDVEKIKVKVSKK